MALPFCYCTFRLAGGSCCDKAGSPQQTVAFGDYAALPEQPKQPVVLSPNGIAGK